MLNIFLLLCDGALHPSDLATREGICPFVVPISQGN